ncbi:MAG: formate/nitrite transporter family protein [Saprospiraceae bacterium]|nr:formate/nitrite transporter family protein [Saprospiraceae bacterium]HRG68561.1 formate/nitrite transporter family protein [Saprospiraceae bacterium]
MQEIYGFDAFSPKEIAERVENLGVQKARLPVISMVMLGILAGAFIGLGAMFYILILSDANLSFGISRLLSGMVFSLGLILVIVAGAELFTGNNLLVMACADGKIRLGELFRNWGIVCLSNFIGAFGLTLLVFLSKHPEMNGGLIGQMYIKIASIKCNLSFQQAFFSGMLCNILVCLAVWMAMAGRSIVDKVLVIIFPVTTFVACGFEHSIANMYLIPMAILVKGSFIDLPNTDLINWYGFVKNLIPVILGNLSGGSVFVALIYYIIYKR